MVEIIHSLNNTTLLIISDVKYLLRLCILIADGLISYSGRTTVREVLGSSPGLTDTQGLKITEEKVMPL